MTRWFNVAGPCDPADHYMLPAAERLPQVPPLVAKKQYFVLHAPRQTGKTTAILDLSHDFTASGTYAAVTLSLEVGAPFSEDIGAAEDAILASWREAASFYLAPDLQPPAWPHVAAGQRIGAALTAWASICPRPLIVFLDEIDSLRNIVLISILRQIRSGYMRRPTAFPWSIGLIGLRDVRDYKVASGGSERLNTTSPFNIKTDSLTLQTFTATEVAILYGQHTADTGQIFTEAATTLAFELTQGQPWLINALARQVVEVLVTDRTRPIEAAHIEQAKEILIQRQDTHLDSLAERLRDPRVRKIIEPILAGQILGDVAEDDRRFAIDLGLVRRDPAAGLVIANPIYREVIPRVLANGAQDSLPQIAPTWLEPDGSLDLDQLLAAFLDFWRQHGQPLLLTAPYHEIAPHLVLMAFLHRVVNGSGTLQREYAIGTDRMDLCLRYGTITLGIEIKVWRDGRPDPLHAGLAQLDRYLAGLAQSIGWLIIFDQRSNVTPIADRTTTDSAVTPSGRVVVLVRA